MDRWKILVVDNDKDTAHYVCRYLEKSGYEALEAYDGETALLTIRREKPDLVVLELALPDHDGLELTRAIRDDPRLFGLPIIILSARASESDKQFGLDLGADDKATIHLALTADENPPLDAQGQAKTDHQGLLDCRPAGAGE